MNYPPPTREEIVRVESAVGFPLPLPLVSLYSLRGNGGFGPHYGLLGLDSGHVTSKEETALDLYRELCSPDPQDPGWTWPKHLLPILDLGCGIYYCIDLASLGNPIVQFDPIGFDLADSWDDAYRVVFPKLESWLSGL